LCDLGENKSIEKEQKIKTHVGPFCFIYFKGIGVLLYFYNNLILDKIKIAYL